MTRPRQRARIVAHNGAHIFGGAERWTVRTLAGLQRRGHEVLLLCADEAVAAGAERHGVPSEIVRVGGHVALPHALGFARALRRHRPDGLLLTTFKKTFLTAFGARIARTPRVIVRIGLSTDLPSRRWVYRAAFRHWIDRVVANSDEIRGAVLSDLAGVAPDRVVTVYNGVPRPRPLRDRVEVAEEVGIPPGTRVVGVVARLDPIKRLDRFLEVIERLSGGARGCGSHREGSGGAEPPPLVGVLVGDGPDEGALRARAQQLGITERVRFLGHREDVPDLLQLFDLFLLTSEREGMSNAMVEALAQGVPVVSTPVSGAAEALDRGESGAPGIVAGHDPESLALAVKSILGDPERRAEMAEAARIRARGRFDFEAKLTIWETLLTRDVNAPVHEGPSPLNPTPSGP